MAFALARGAALVVMACLSALACGDSRGRSDVICTQIGCSDGLQLAVRSNAAWLPGSYTLELQLPEWSRSCSFQLPLEADSEGRAPAAALDCTPSLELAVQAETTCSNEAAESGSASSGPCVVLQEQYNVQGFITEPLSGELAVMLRRDGATLLAERRLLEYRELFPNGPGCGAVCRQASVEMVLPD